MTLVVKVIITLLATIIAALIADRTLLLSPSSASNNVKSSSSNLETESAWSRWRRFVVGHDETPPKVTLGRLNLVETADDLHHHLKSHLYKDKRSVLIEFFSPDCRACQYFDSIIKAASKANPTVLFLQINAPENRGLSYQFNVEYYPKIVLMTPSHGTYEYDGKLQLDEFNSFVRHVDIHSNYLYAFVGPMSPYGRAKYWWGHWFDLVMERYEGLVAETGPAEQFAISVGILSTMAFALLLVLFLVLNR